MDDLLTLINISKKKGQRSIQLVNQNFRKTEISKDNLLFEGIVKGDYTSEEDAALDIFGEKPGNRNFRNAKGKLKQKLLNHLYFLDYDKDCYSLYDKYNYECLHSLHQGKILINEGAGETALKLFPQLIKISKGYEFVDISVEAHILLRNQYAKMGKTTLYMQLEKELQQVEKFQQAVHECEKMYYGILAYVNKSMSAQQRAVKDIPPVITKVKEAAKSWKSTRLDVLGLKLQLLYNTLMQDYEANLKLCHAIEIKYLNKPSLSVDMDRRKIAFSKLLAYFCLKDAKNGGPYAEKKLKLFKKGSSEWFNFIEYYFLLMMKSEQYKKADDVFRKIRTDKNYNLLDKMHKGRWQVYRAYLILVKDSKLLRWGFDIQSFMNETPNFPKDLMGYNTSVYAIQYLYFLQQGNVEKVREKVKRLQQYNSTHLDKRHNYRNSMFIRLLSMVTEKDFNYKQVRDKGNTYYNKLKKMQIPDDLSYDLEIIPFESLWENVLHILNTNKVYTHYRFYKVSSI